MSHAPLRRIAGVRAVPGEDRGAVVAVGNFDGVHRGHQAVLDVARAAAEASGRPLVCLTFEPHPRSVFRPDHPVARLTPAPMKARILAALGFDAVVEQPFDRAFASQAPEAFVETALIESLAVSHVVAGFDFHYGARRTGTPATLAEAGARHGFAVTIVEAYRDEGDVSISSSRIRALLRAGDAPGAAALLGYRWCFSGPVVHGAKLGRTLGYPTANLVLSPDDLLAHGIYAVRVRRADGSLFDGVASYGRRPTFDNGAALFETFLFDFSGDLYGEEIAISLVVRLRGEERFETVEALVARMDIDAAQARACLSGLTPLSPLDARLTF